MLSRSSAVSDPIRAWLTTLGMTTLDARIFVRDLNPHDPDHVKRLSSRTVLTGLSASPCGALIRLSRPLWRKSQQ